MVCFKWLLLMWERLRRFSAMDVKARGMFVRAAVLLPIISVSLRTRGFRATQRYLHRALPPARQAAPATSIHAAGDLERIKLTTRMVNTAVRQAWRASTCLEKSLALWWLLGRQGIACELRIGARKQGGKFEAHAWLERDGVAINEPQQEHRHYSS